MPRRPRFDRVGLLLHLFDRGIARRPVFETRADVRYFLACVARAVRRGEIEVLAYAILTTHFHLLVRSTNGRVAEAMRRILNEYVRYFNRTRRRDGALFRGRYGAKPVTTLRYLWILMRYIDENPVKAGLVARPEEYPYGSAHAYARARRPRWLAVSWVDEQVRDAGWSDVQEGYRHVFGPLRRTERAIVLRRFRRAAPGPDALDDLIEAAPDAVVAWMRRKTALADRTSLGPACVDARAVMEEVERSRLERPDWTVVTRNGRPIDAWPAATALLLRSLASLGLEQIGTRLGVSHVRARTRVQQAAGLLEDAAFAGVVGALSRRILDAAHGAPGVTSGV